MGAAAMGEAERMERMRRTGLESSGRAFGFGHPGVPGDRFLDYGGTMGLPGSVPVSVASSPHLDEMAFRERMQRQRLLEDDA